MAERERRITPPYGGVFVARKRVMDAEAVRRAVTRIAHEVIERNAGLEDVVIVGLQTGGVPLARALTDALQEIDGTKLPVRIEAAQHIPSGEGWVESTDPLDVADFQWFRQRTTAPP